MSKSNRVNFPRVNFFDGQRVTESDLDTEQIYHRNLFSNAILDFHQSGIVRDRVFESTILLDTSMPSAFSEGTNPSDLKIKAGSFDGSAISVDRQPTDREFGNRLEVEAFGLNIGGRTRAKILILGTRFCSTIPNGELVTEVLEFDKNDIKLTKNFYTRVIAVFFNNFSGGSGKTEYSAFAESENTLGSGGKFVIRESEPLKVFAKTDLVNYSDSPNYDLATFITSSTSLSIGDEIQLALGSSYSFNDLYFELSAARSFLFEPNANATISYGQKFLAVSDNIQRVDLLLYVPANEAAPAGSEYDFSGELVISIHPLLENIKCITDPSPQNLLDFDPDSSPLVEVSYSQEDLADMGIVLRDTPTLVSIDFASSLIADPNIEPSLVAGKYYALMITRRADNSTGTIGVPAGFYRPTRKVSNGQILTPEEQFGRQNHRLIEFDPNKDSFVDYHDLSMWLKIHSDSVEITDGQAYSSDGFPISVPKVLDYVGSTKIPFYLNNINLTSVSEGSRNYIALYREDNFTDPATHPRTGNFVNTKIEDSPVIGVLSSDDLADQIEDSPLLLARVTDENVREAQDITGIADKPGIIYRNYALFINPSSEMLNSNLVGRVFTPDLDCDCNSSYRITSVEHETAFLGDFNSSGTYDTEDIEALLQLVGNTVGTPTTDRKILGGEIELKDLTKADLNADGTVDGEDIELLEDAVDGFVNFSSDQTICLLKINVENILESNDYPVIFNSTSTPSTLNSGETSANTNLFTFNVSSEEEGLAIRLGEEVVISGGASDSGTYKVLSKEFDPVNLLVTLGLEESSGGSASFAGETNLDAAIVSGTKTNMLADNLRLLSVPYTAKNWSIFYAAHPHSESQIFVCDLRRYVETNIIEEEVKTCICDEPTCQTPDICSPILKNQKIIPNDLFIPSGEIYSEPGVPYHGDIEFANISIPLPPGSIGDCQIDLYNNFIKSKDGSCKTAAGYPAMVYSDGTYVGCEDSESNTDLLKNRVKITQCIASLHVDALVDGYAVDGYADEQNVTAANEIISESFSNYSYPSSTGFSDWSVLDPSSGTYFTITSPTTPNTPVEFLLETISAGDRSAGIIYPTSLSDISGDFVVDFIASRVTWSDSSLTTGEVKFFGELIIPNNDGTKTELKLGWRIVAGGDTELFYSGAIKNSITEAVISDFDRSVIAGDDLGDLITFRFRRTGEAVFGMYYDETKLDEASIDGKFIKVGVATGFVSGSGNAELNFKINQSLTPNVSQIFYTKLHSVIIDYNYSSFDATTEQSLEISRDITGAFNRLTFGLPFSLTQRTNIVSAELEFVLAEDFAGGGSFNLIPLEVINANNLGTIIDYPQTTNNSIVGSFTSSALPAGSTLTVDVTGMVVYLLSRSGHLPGFSKGLILEADQSSVTSLFITSSINLTIFYEDITSGVIFKVGAKLDPKTGIVSLDTRNILYDYANPSNRTVLNFGVYLKKSGFKNNDVSVSISDLSRLGVGSCSDESVIADEDLCFFISGNTATGTFVEGPFPCNFHLP